MRAGAGKSLAMLANPAEIRSARQAEDGAPLAGTADNVDIGAIIGQAVGGGVAGAIVTFVVGLIKNAMAGQPAR